MREVSARFCTALCVLLLCRSLTHTINLFLVVRNRKEKSVQTESGIGLLVSTAVVLGLGMGVDTGMQY